MNLFWLTKNPIFPRSFERFLLEEGISIETVCIEPNNAVEQYIRSHADVVIMDFSWYSNEISGVNLLRIFQKADPGVKVIFVTSYFQDVVAAKFKMLGAAGYIHKNDLPENIITVIRQTATPLAKHVRKNVLSVFA